MTLTLTLTITLTITLTLTLTLGHTITRESNAKRRHLAVACPLDTSVDGWEDDAEEWIEEVRVRC